MRATTVFNKIVAPLGVTVTDVAFEGDVVILSVRARRRRLVCSCGWSTSAVYDRSVRRWRHLDASGKKVFLQGEVRRLDCRRCGRVVSEEVTWARRGARHTRLFDDVVAWWCQRADRTSVARFWRADWATVTAIAARVVTDSLDDSRFDGLTRIGVDEISWAKGHFSGVTDPCGSVAGRGLLRGWCHTLWIPCATCRTVSHMGKFRAGLARHADRHAGLLDGGRRRLAASPGR